MPAQYGKGWAEGRGAQLHDLEVPSGDTVLVRRPGVDGLMKAGVLSEVDTLTSLVQTKHIDPQKNLSKAKAKQGEATAKELSALMKDPGALEAVQRVCYKITAHMVVRPTVLLHFVPWLDAETEKPILDDKGRPTYRDLTKEEREDAELDARENQEYAGDPIVFTDAVDFGDAMFLMNYAVGGTRDLESFRSQFDQSLASVESL